MHDLTPVDGVSASAPVGAPEARAWMCGECGRLFTSDGLLDYCDSCGAPRCRACATRDGDGMNGVYICTTCANDLDPL